MAIVAKNGFINCLESSVIISTHRVFTIQTSVSVYVAVSIPYFLALWFTVSGVVSITRADGGGASVYQMLIIKPRAAP